MSRDLTSDDWIAEIIGPRRDELDKLERHLRHIQRLARAEGRAERTEEQPPAADATAPREGFRMPDKLLHRDSGGMPILPPYTPPAP